MGQRSSGRDGDNGCHDTRAAFRIEQSEVCGGSGNFAKTAVFGLGGSRFGVCKKRRQGCCRQAHYAFYGVLRAGGLSVYLRIFRRHSDSRRNRPTIGGWLWGLIPEKETFAVAYINGFYLADVWKELMANLISAYIGAGITRKAFTLGK